MIDADIFEACKLWLYLFPPNISRTIGVDDHLLRSTTGFFESFFTWQSEFNPQFNIVSQTFLPQIGLVVAA